MHVHQRVYLLFVFGFAVSIWLSTLFRQHRIYTVPPSSFTILNCVWWLPPASGVASVLLGIGFPLMDEWLGVKHQVKREWSSVIRCFGLFIGLTYASAKLPGMSNVELAVVLGLMAGALWWLFDRSWQGLAGASVFTVVATASCQLLVYVDLLRYTQPDLFWVRSWLPCMLFAGGVCFGNIGRQLAVEPPALKPASNLQRAYNGTQKSNHVKRE